MVMIVMMMIPTVVTAAAKVMAQGKDVHRLQHPAPLQVTDSTNDDDDDDNGDDDGDGDDGDDDDGA